MIRRGAHLSRGGPLIPRRGGWLIATLLVALTFCAQPDAPPLVSTGETGPMHTRIPVTTFWVGEVFDPDAADGSQRISTYDSRWLERYGGCDGTESSGRCETEHRYRSEGWFPREMTPLENPFYLDLPLDDVNSSKTFARRCEIIPWADASDRRRCTDPEYSYMKNRWVRIIGPSSINCYGQVQDAGPGVYGDAAYVFGDDDPRPTNDRYGGAGLDISPALTGCLGLRDIDGSGERVSWQFIDEALVPAGPWRHIVTTSGVTP